MKHACAFNVRENQYKDEYAKHGPFFNYFLTGVSDFNNVWSF